MKMYTINLKWNNKIIANEATRKKIWCHDNVQLMQKKKKNRKKKKYRANEKQVAKLKPNHVSSHIIYRNLIIHMDKKAGTNYKLPTRNPLST